MESILEPQNSSQNLTLLATFVNTDLILTMKRYILYILLFDKITPLSNNTSNNIS